VHCVVPAGGISPDHQRWIHTRPKFLLPIPVLKEVFRGKFLDGVMRLFRARKLLLTSELAALRSEKAFRSFLKPLGEKEWVVYAKAPSADLTTSSNTSLDTPIGSPSPTTASSLSTATQSPSVGWTTRMATRSGK
jgi:hypothetical protein